MFILNNKWQDLQAALREAHGQVIDNINRRGHVIWGDVDESKRPPFYAEFAVRSSAAPNGMLVNMTDLFIRGAELWNGVVDFVNNNPDKVERHYRTENTNSVDEFIGFARNHQSFCAKEFYTVGGEFGVWMNGAFDTFKRELLDTRVVTDVYAMCGPMMVLSEDVQKKYTMHWGCPNDFLAGMSEPECVSNLKELRFNAVMPFYQGLCGYSHALLWGDCGYFERPYAIGAKPEDREIWFVHSAELVDKYKAFIYNEYAPSWSYEVDFRLDKARVDIGNHFETYPLYMYKAFADDESPRADDDVYIVLERAFSLPQQ